MCVSLCVCAYINNGFAMYTCMRMYFIAHIYMNVLTSQTPQVQNKILIVCELARLEYTHTHVHVHVHTQAAQDRNKGPTFCIAWLEYAHHIYTHVHVHTHQAAQEQKQNNNLLHACMTGMVASLRPQYTPNIIVLQVAPYLSQVLQPNVKLVRRCINK